MLPRPRRLARSCLLAVLGAALVCTLQAAGADVGLERGQRLPSFSGRDLDGESHTLSQYRGKVLILHFWATWCPYCRGEIPKLTRIHEQWGTQEVRVLTVSVDEQVSELKRFLREWDLPYPVIAAATQRVSFAERFEVSGIPVTYIIDPTGRIAVRFNGAGDLIMAVRDVLANLGSPSA